MGKVWLTRLTATPYARLIAVSLLTVAAERQAVAQALVLRGPGSDVVRHAGFTAGLTAQYVLPLGLLALLATVPLAVCRPALAAVTVTCGNALALACFGQVTAGGVTAEVAAAGWLGLAGGLDGPAASRALGLLPLGGSRGPGTAVSGTTAGRYLAVVLAGPFAVLALTGGHRAAVVLAAAVPVAAGLGISVWAGRLARTRTTAGEILMDTLLAHTARGERARIARELHDVVAHHISMIAVLSETGRLTTPGLPEAGARRFAEIGDTARTGLTEMRRLLGVLREDARDIPDPAGRGLDGGGARGAAAAPVPAGTPASRQPQPGLTQLTELVDAARDTSRAATRLIISGPVRPLDTGVELAAYRIVQEALTNTRRHAPGAAVDVELRYGPETLRLRVRDIGPGQAAAPGGAGAPPAGGRPAEIGHGLLGMRERALSVGGTLQAGTAAGGGFVVEAVLPARAGAAPAGAGAAGLTAGAGQ